MNNTTIGNKRENQLCDLFKKHHYWAHVCAKNASGSQPIDVIAIKGERRFVAWLVDAKNVEASKPSFPLERIEDNQWISLQYARDFAGIPEENLGFAVFFERMNKFYWLGLKQAMDMRNNDIKSINLELMREFEEILNEYDN